MAAKFGVSDRTIKCHINDIKYLKYVGSSYCEINEFKEKKN